MANINASSMLSVGTVLKDTYRIERYLSSGGFGNTYVATNFTFNENVAVKEFFLRGINLRDKENTVSVSNPDNRALFDEQLEKFRKEAQRIRKLRSPHVVRVHDMFDANGTAYYVMDFIDGESLGSRLCRTNQPLDESEAMRYFGQVLEALEAIHSAGLCHMDLKPDNIMVDKEDNAVLIDFGASKKIANDQLTSTLTGVSYTNGYAPPEQLESDTDNFGPWTDIYALGATLYKLLTNRKPPMPSAIYSDPTPDKSKSLPFPESVSPLSRQLVRKLMTVAWHERPQSVEEVRRMMGQAKQENTEYPPQETTSIKGPTDSDDASTMVMNKQKREFEENTLYSKKGQNASSRKWMYALIGLIAAGVIFVGFLLLKKTNNTTTSIEVAKPPKPKTITIPKLKDGDYYYKSYWKTTEKDSSQCLLQFKKQGDTLTNCSFTNVAYAKTIPLSGEINVNKLHFSGKTDGNELIIDVENTTEDGNTIKGTGQDKQSGLQSVGLNLTKVDKNTGDSIKRIAMAQAIPTYSELRTLAERILKKLNGETLKKKDPTTGMDLLDDTFMDGIRVGSTVYGKNVKIKSKDDNIMPNYEFQPTSNHACYVYVGFTGKYICVNFCFNNKADADAFDMQRKKAKVKNINGNIRFIEKSQEDGWWRFSYGDY